MKLSIERDVLAKALLKAGPVSDFRTTLPILNFVLMNAKESTLRLVASSLEVEMVAEGDASIEVAGDFLVPGKHFLNFVKQLPGGPIDLELTDDKRLSVKNANGKWTLHGITDIDDFPPVVDHEAKATFSVDNKNWWRGVDKVMPSISKDVASSFNLNCMLLEDDEVGSRLVTTDGHRLSLCQLGPPLGLEKKSWLLPGASLPYIRSAFEGATGSLNIILQEKTVTFSMDGTAGTIRIVDAQPVAYRRVIEKPAEIKTKVDCAGMADAVRRAMLFSSTSVRFTATGDAWVTISCGNNHGDAEERVLATPSEPFEILLNPNYVLDALSTIDTAEVEFGVTMENGKSHSMAPAWFRSPDSEEHFMIVMAMEPRG